MHAAFITRLAKVKVSKFTGMAVGKGQLQGPPSTDTATNRRYSHFVGQHLNVCFVRPWSSGLKVLGDFGRRKHLGDLSRGRSFAWILSSTSVHNIPEVFENALRQWRKANRLSVRYIVSIIFLPMPVAAFHSSTHWTGVYFGFVFQSSIPRWRISILVVTQGISSPLASGDIFRT